MQDKMVSQHMDKFHEGIQKARKLGFLHSEDTFNISWINVDDDTQDMFNFIEERVFNRQGGNMTFYGLHTEVDVKTNGNQYLVDVINSGSGKVMFSRFVPLGFDNIRDFTLIHFRGSDGIHDYGKLVMREEEEHSDDEEGGW